MRDSDKYGWLSTIAAIGGGIIAGIFSFKANQAARKEMKDELERKIEYKIAASQPVVVEEDVPYQYVEEE